MKERPILMSAPMVRAILDGSKVQTRRVMTNQPFEGWSPFFYGELHGYDKHGELSPDKVIGWGPVNEDGEYGYKSRLGQPGDRLWVRETFNRTNPGGESGIYFYRADNNPDYEDAIWKPSIFMPRWASRITLEITAVRVERLQDISLGDCMAEGCPFPNMANGTDPKKWYADLWNSINGPAAWDKNPWIWCLTFRRIV